jgi:hypothetical protein
MFENVQIFSHLQFKYANSAIVTTTKIFLKNINMGIKNAEFYADFKFVDADFNKLDALKKARAKKLGELSIFVFVHFFVVFCF